MAHARKANYNIFLSYDSKNQKVIQLHDFLKSEGLTVWFDRERMLIGNINDLLCDGVANSDLFICCLTENYRTRENCKQELNLAQSYRKKILTVFFDEENMSYNDILKKYEEIAYAFAGKIIYKINDLNKLKNAIFSILADLNVKVTRLDTSSEPSFKDIQTKEAFQELILFTEKEIKVLKSIKQSIKDRLEEERKSSEKLKKMAQSSRSNLLNDFIIEKSWNEFQNANLLYYEKTLKSCHKIETTTLPRLEELIQEKLSSKEKLVSENAKLKDVLKKLNSKEEIRIQNEYKEEIVKINALKLAVDKSNSKISDKHIQKLRKHGEKLHNIHNDYEYLIKEFNYLNGFYKNTFFPNLIKSFQIAQGMLLKEYKEVMKEYCANLNYFGSNFKDVDKESRKSVNLINSETYKFHFLPIDLDFQKESIFYKNMTFNKMLTKNILFGNLIEPMVTENKFSCNLITSSKLEEKKTMIRAKLGELVQKKKHIERSYSILERSNKNISTNIQILFLNNENKMVDSEIINVWTKLQNSLNLNSENRGLEIRNVQITNDPLVTYPYLYSFAEDLNINETENNESKYIPLHVVNYSDNGENFIYHTNESLNLLTVENLKQFDCYDNNNLDSNVLFYLESKTWFHGYFPQSHLLKLLKQNGDFLIRVNQSENEGNNKSTDLLISLMSETGIESIRLYQDAETFEYVLGHLKSKTVHELIELCLNKELVIDNEKYLPCNPVSRQEWEIKHIDLINMNNISSGEFGTVYRGIFKNNEVAIKILKSGISGNDKLVKEAMMLQKYQHKNIVKFIGISLLCQPFQLVMELVKGGSLLNFLKNNPNISVEKKLKLSKDCAEALFYLETNRVLHLDVAAKNFLLDENIFILKLADFGSVVELNENYNSLEIDLDRSLPIRWIAYEVYTSKHITKESISWSFGIFLWELFSNGCKPYIDLSKSEVIEKVPRGYRMCAPNNCPIKVYDLMKKCWESIPSDRPSFNVALIILEAIINETYSEEPIYTTLLEDI